VLRLSVCPDFATISSFSALFLRSSQSLNSSTRPILSVPANKALAASQAEHRPRGEAIEERSGSLDALPVHVHVGYPGRTVPATCSAASLCFRPSSLAAYRHSPRAWLSVELRYSQRFAHFAPSPFFSRALLPPVTLSTNRRNSRGREILRTTGRRLMIRSSSARMGLQRSRFTTRASLRRPQPLRTSRTCPPRQAFSRHRCKPYKHWATGRVCRSVVYPRRPFGRQHVFPAYRRFLSGGLCIAR
jgi:hypothetical protein